MGREGDAVRTRAKVDGNQAEIVKALRGVGCSVQHLHTVGKGCPDILVGRDGMNILMEIKDGSLPPSRRALTDDEAEWHDAWRGSVCVVKSVEDALTAIGIK